MRLVSNKPKQGYNIALILLGIAQTAVVGLALAYVFWHCHKTNDLRSDANWMDSASAYIVRLAFWAVLLVGLADAVLSFLRVEGFHTVLFGEAGGAAIALPSQRGFFVHIPLILLAGLIAVKEKSVSFVWLTLLVVMAEFLIVVARFIYGYEQTFMGDLVRLLVCGAVSFCICLHVKRRWACFGLMCCMRVCNVVRNQFSILLVRCFLGFRSAG